MKQMNVFNTNENVDTYYYLMNKEQIVLKFNSKKSVIKGFEIIEIYNKDLLPYAIKSNVDRFTGWLDGRPIATNQEHLHKVLDSLGIKTRNTIELLKINNGFSLNDSFWIQAEHENSYAIPTTWKNGNLYHNDWDSALGLVSFFGNASSLGGTLRTPEITNQGSVGKAWRKVDNKLLLYKKTSEGAANYGKEHYSEVVSSNVAKLLGLDSVEYWEDTWHSKECCVCEIFTNEDIGYLPMSYYLLGQNIVSVDCNYQTVYNLLSDSDKIKFNDMLVFDFIIENWDRHLSNFGMLINNNTQEPIALAPIFDNGYSLMARDMESDMIGRDFLSYTRENPSFRVSNRELAYYIINGNKKRYKHWANLIGTHIENVANINCPKWYSIGIKNLLRSRCKEIENI